jgi:hypothetical protein
MYVHIIGAQHWIACWLRVFLSISFASLRQSLFSPRMPVAAAADFICLWADELEGELSERTVKKLSIAR